jgi:hypothetical protein
MSALPPKADIETQSRHVRFVPEADMPEDCSRAKEPIAFRVANAYWEFKRWFEKWQW